MSAQLSKMPLAWVGGHVILPACICFQGFVHRMAVSESDCERALLYADARMRSVLERLVAYDNIPRKKAKFENFCRNSLGVCAASRLCV